MVGHQSATDGIRTSGHTGVELFQGTGVDGITPGHAKRIICHDAAPALTSALAAVDADDEV